MTAASPIGKRRDIAALVIAGGLVALAAVVAWDASRLGAGGAYARIGPQTIPYAIAICLAGLGAWTAVEAWRGDFPERSPQDYGPVLWIVGGLLVQMILIKFIGFSVATGLLFAMTARGLGRVSIAKTLVAGILLSVAVWFVFARLLRLTLPEGPPEKALIPVADAVVANTGALWLWAQAMFPSGGG